MFCFFFFSSCNGATVPGFRKIVFFCLKINLILNSKSETFRLELEQIKCSRQFFIQGSKICHPKMCLWHEYYFKLKTIKAQSTQEETSTFPITSSRKQIENLLYERSYYHNSYNSNFNINQHVDKTSLAKSVLKLLSLSHYFCMTQQPFIYADYLPPIGGPKSYSQYSFHLQLKMAFKVMVSAILLSYKFF